MVMLSNERDILGHQERQGIPVCPALPGALFFPAAPSLRNLRCIRPDGYLTSLIGFRLYLYYSL